MIVPTVAKKKTTKKQRILSVDLSEINYSGLN